MVYHESSCLKEVICRDLEDVRNLKILRILKLKFWCVFFTCDSTPNTIICPVISLLLTILLDLDYCTFHSNVFSANISSYPIDMNLIQYARWFSAEPIRPDCPWMIPRELFTHVMSCSSLFLSIQYILNSHFVPFHILRRLTASSWACNSSHRDVMTPPTSKYISRFVDSLGITLESSKKNVWSMFLFNIMILKTTILVRKL